MDKTRSIKTIYNHTSTAKLGDLRLKDTFYSVNRVIAAFSENDAWRHHNLTTYEHEVFKGVVVLMQQMPFAKENFLSPEQAVRIITQSVIVPRIGQRVALDAPSRHIGI